MVFFYYVVLYGVQFCILPCPPLWQVPQEYMDELNGLGAGTLAAHGVEDGDKMASRLVSEERERGSEMEEAGS